MTSVQEMVRDSGELPFVAWPGGYPLAYVTRRGDTLCPGCANRALEEASDDPPAEGFVNWEDAALYCDGCSSQIEAAYGA